MPGAGITGSLLIASRGAWIQTRASDSAAVPSARVPFPFSFFSAFSPFRFFVVRIGAHLPDWASHFCWPNLAPPKRSFSICSIEDIARLSGSQCALSSALTLVFLFLLPPATRWRVCTFNYSHSECTNQSLQRGRLLQDWTARRLSAEESHTQPHEPLPFLPVAGHS